MNINKAQILTFLLILLSTFSAYACRCEQPKELTYAEYFEAELIFEGTITKVESDRENYGKTVTFEITENIKTEAGIKTITITTAENSAACGLNVSKGQKWYIWGKSNGKGGYASNTCTRSQLLPEEKVTPQYLDRYKKEKELIKSFQTMSGKQTIQLREGKATGKLCKGRRHGKWKFYDANGILTEECKYKKGKMVYCSKDDK